MAGFQAKASPCEKGMSDDMLEVEVGGVLGWDTRGWLEKAEGKPDSTAPGEKAPPWTAPALENETRRLTRRAPICGVSEKFPKLVKGIAENARG
jgi:hypothetical protein